MNENIISFQNRDYNLDEETEQINFLDQRFYKRKNEYYPSITYILQYYPKDSNFINWLKTQGLNSDYIVKKASKEGTQTHKLIEDYLLGKKIKWLNSRGNPKYSIEVWEMLLKFKEFWETFKPKLINSEILLYNDKYKIGGTCDLIIELNNELWLIDLKTSNYLHKSYDLQISAYVKCYERMFDKKIDQAGILWLKSSKRKLNKEKIWGKGWELYKSNRSIEENFSYFKKVYELFKLENPNAAPIFNSYPTEVSL